MRCELCGTNVKVVGHTTKHYEPVVDKEMVVNIIKDNCKSFWKLSRNTKATPYKIGRLADAIIKAMYGDTNDPKPIPSR